MTLPSNSKHVLRIQFVVGFGLTIGALTAGIGVAGEYFADSTRTQLMGMELTVISITGASEEKESLLESIYKTDEAAIESHKRHEIAKWVGFSIVFGAIIYGFKSISKLN